MITAAQIARAMELLSGGVMPWLVKAQTGVGYEEIELAAVHGFDLFPPAEFRITPAGGGANNTGSQGAASVDVGQGLQPRNQPRDLTAWPGR